MPVKFRASSVGNLLTGGNAITEKQLQRLAELEQRKWDEFAKPLTAKMEEELADLIAKRDAPFQFGATAMSYIRDTWLKNTFGYDEPVVTNEILKGLMCEDQAIEVLTRQIPGYFRLKNEETFEDEHFTGTPDVVEKVFVEDIKCSWSLKTFVEVRTIDPLYYAQGQVYMALTDREWFRLAHILVDTPDEIVLEEQKRFYFRFNCDENNPHYIEASRKVEAMHYASRIIPESQRIKMFEFHRNDAYINTLRERVEQAREVYDSLTLESGLLNGQQY